MASVFPHALVALRRVLQRTQPDVVVSFLWDSNILNILSRVFLAHQVIISERNALGAKIADVFGTGLKGTIAGFFTKTIYRFASRIIAVSSGVREELLSAGLPSANVVAIPNPIDLDFINARKSEPLDIERPFVLFVGRLSKQKNVDVLIEAFDLLSNEGLGLRIVGSGEEEHSLRKLVANLGLKERITFIPFDPNPFRYMARAEAFVLPSRYEGFPNVLVEAMACGTPVIAADCCEGVREIVKHDVTGLLFAVGDKEALSNSIKRIMSDSDLRENMIREATRAIERFNVATIVKRYEDEIVHACR